MSVDVTPWAIDGNTHAAADARSMLNGILGGVETLFVTSPTAIDGAHGINAATDLAVTQNGTPNMSVNVASGSAFVRSGQAAGQAYHARSTATVNLSIAAADAVNARNDLVILQVRDAEFSGADRDARLFVVTGTPAASPADPSLASFPNALVLARVNVPALDTAITNGQITDLRRARGSGPRARVFNSTTQIIANNSNVNRVFNSETYDTDAMHSTSSNTDRLTCVVPGVYMIGYSAGFGAGLLATVVLAGWMESSAGGGRRGFTQMSANNANGVVLTGTDVLVMAVGDYVTNVVYQNSGANANTDGTSNLTFWANYMGRA